MAYLFQDDPDQSASPQPNEGADLPASFSENFAAAWSRNQLFSQDALGENDRMAVVDDYLGDIKRKTGFDLAPKLDYGGAGGGGSMSAAGLLEQANAKVGELQLPIAPMTSDELEQGAIAKRRQADADFAAQMNRERGPGGTLGAVAGGLAAGLADPINLVALPAAPAEDLGILAAGLRWGAIGAGVQAGSEAVRAPYMEQVQPGYLSSGEPLENIGEAALTAGIGGAGFHALGNLWTRLKTGAWPTSIRDAGNVVESEANIAGSNIYGGAEGEAAHRAALSKAIDQVLGGMPVDVRDVITPELEAQSRALMARLEGERAVSLPVYDERTIRLMSEEAGLQEQHAQLGAELEGLPQGDQSAADRLNRLQAVEAQLPNASPEMRRALLQRRDQILVDTTPEALQSAAEPIARRQTLGAQQERVAGRLEEIAAERRQIEAQNLSELGKAPIGQTMPIRGVPLEALRSHAESAAAMAERLRSNLGLEGPRQGELPFEQTAAEGQAKTLNEALVSSVQQISRRAGYNMPAEEAGQVAAKLLKQSPDEAAETFRALQSTPKAVAHLPLNAEREEHVIEPMASVDTNSPKFTTDMDLNREAESGDVKLPYGPAEGDQAEKYRGLNEQIANDVSALNDAAGQLEGCASGGEPEAEAA